MLFLRSLRSQTHTWLPIGLVSICLGAIISTPRRDGPAANSSDRCNNESRGRIVVQIDLPLATDPVFLGPSRLANVKYCLVLLTLYSEMSMANKYTNN